MTSERSIGDVMTPHVVTLPPDATVREAAAQMREHDIGDVVVVDGEGGGEGGGIRGVLTDRDVVVRVVAADRDANTATVGECCTGDVVTVRPDTGLDEAVQRLRESAVRRLPVVDDEGRPVGMVSIGDLARSDDSRSALADISAAPPNT
ncbi:CBS domain-containing protein [Jiangella mangrovi]|uniref:CBS domain-containing protein n=1 Tax=Jiangella mangrovi TaxID=1524084 RepID=A0A7W9GUN9_9ACTN|nr:CBS domain-containing protein [Jiangella mangrovi]MBB5790036.1 CBS domain-containing protein [Jiangella mangrovi]